MDAAILRDLVLAVGGLGTNAQLEAKRRIQDLAWELVRKEKPDDETS